MPLVLPLLTFLQFILLFCPVRWTFGIVTIGGFYRAVVSWWLLASSFLRRSPLVAGGVAGGSGSGGVLVAGVAGVAGGVVFVLGVAFLWPTFLWTFATFPSFSRSSSASRIGGKANFLRTKNKIPKEISDQKISEPKTETCSN